MARAGLGEDWQCLFANDIDAKKAQSYRANWDSRELVVDDVNNISTDQLPGQADLAWASFPCQDLSLAGNGHGLNGHRSGAFWPFWRLMEQLADQDRAPRVILLENVVGALSSDRSRGFAAIGEALSSAGYDLGAVVMDAVHFLPQSRPRLFIIGVQQHLRRPGEIEGVGATGIWHPQTLRVAHRRLSQHVQQNWIWWSLPLPSTRRINLSDLIEDEPQGVDWNSEEKTQALIDMMSPLNRAKLDAAKRAPGRTVGTLYRRTRHGEQRAEVRFDQIAGCLRTPTGGSSRQTLLIVEGQHVRSRLLSPRETVRLMGLPDHYQLPTNYNAAYHLAGDGVAVPVVRYLAAHIIEPILEANNNINEWACDQIEEPQPAYG